MPAQKSRGRKELSKPWKRRLKRISLMVTFGTPCSWRRRKASRWSMMRPTPSSAHQVYAPRSSRTMLTIDPSSCCSPRQGKQPAQKVGPYPHPLRSRRSMCGPRRCVTTMGSRISFKKPRFGWMQTASGSWCNSPAATVASSWRLCAGCSRSSNLVQLGICRRRSRWCAKAMGPAPGVVERMRSWVAYDNAALCGWMGNTAACMKCRASSLTSSARARTSCQRMSAETLASTASFSHNPAPPRSSRSSTGQIWRHSTTPRTRCWPRITSTCSRRRRACKCNMMTASPNMPQISFSGPCPLCCSTWSWAIKARRRSWVQMAFQQRMNTTRHFSQSWKRWSIRPMPHRQVGRMESRTLPLKSMASDLSSKVWSPATDRTTSSASICIRITRVITGASTSSAGTTSRFLPPWRSWMETSKWSAWSRTWRTPPTRCMWRTRTSPASTASWYPATWWHGAWCSTTTAKPSSILSKRCWASIHLRKLSPVARSSKFERR